MSFFRALFFCIKVRLASFQLSLRVFLLIFPLYPPPSLTKVGLGADSIYREFSSLRKLAFEQVTITLLTHSIRWAEIIFFSILFFFTAGESFNRVGGPLNGSFNKKSVKMQRENKGISMFVAIICIIEDVCNCAHLFYSDTLITIDNR